jgi:hypothetical protein
VESVVGRIRGLSLVDVVIDVALAGFLFLSGYAAFEGLFDLILAEQPSLATERQRYYIAAAVILITGAMWALLELFLRRGQFRRRVVALLVYLLLALWSVGFGYGFWWKVIASRAETRTGIEAAAAAVEQQVNSAENAVRLIEGLLKNVVGNADAKQKSEISQGSSCGVTSPPGVGPLAKLRTEVTSNINSLRANVDTLWLMPLREALDGHLNPDGTRSGGLKDAQSKLDPKKMRELAEDERRRIYEEVRKAAADSINAIKRLNSTQGALFAKQLNALATDLEVRPTNRYSTCYDPELARVLRDAAEIATSSPTLELPDFEINEGAAATAKAFNKIWDNIFWLVRQPISRLGLVSSQAPPEPLRGRDSIALVASVAVDVCIFIFAFIGARRPLDASHLFQPARRGARAKLESTIRAFAADENLNARKVFNLCILRSGRHYYFILPSLSSTSSPAWQIGAAFLQNVLLVLEAVRAIERTYEPTGIRASFRSLIPGLGMNRVFEKAAAQLNSFSWGMDAAESHPSSGPITPDALSLHMFRPSDLLELLLLLRTDASSFIEPDTAEKFASKPSGVEATHSWPVDKRIDRIFDAIDDLDRVINAPHRDGSNGSKPEELAVAERQLTTYLTDLGLQKTARIGDAADPVFHRITGKKPSSLPTGTILEILTQGYRDTATGRMVREAAVVVAGRESEKVERQPGSELK